jgi:aspartate/methionine/tyrosine aminotransferase
MKDSKVRNEVQLVNFHSVSKGFLGECGLRGGYFEMINFEEAVVDQLYKLSSISLCSNVTGQLAMGLASQPPKQGEPSYELYAKESQGIIESLKRRAKIVTNAFNKLEGVVCNESEGALYAFPKISIPAKAVEAAKKSGRHPDAMYSLSLLEHTGICVVPGSGFGQSPGTYHFRTTILPSEKEMAKVVELFAKHHVEFMNKYK